MKLYEIESFLFLHQVERGTSAYLSGLREKYFGEVFLNASFSLGGWPTTESDLKLSFSDSLGGSY